MVSIEDLLVFGVVVGGGYGVFDDVKIVVDYFGDWGEVVGSIISVINYFVFFVFIFVGIDFYYIGVDVGFFVRSSD